MQRITKPIAIVQGIGKKGNGKYYNPSDGY
jgi:hypothetical protein